MDNTSRFIYASKHTQRSMHIIPHMISTFNYTYCKRTRYRHHAVIITHCCTQSFGHMCRRRLSLTHTRTNTQTFNLASAVGTGAAYDLLISGQRRPLFVCSLPVQFRHKFLCVLSLPWQIEREGRVEGEGGKWVKTECVCLLAGLLISSRAKPFLPLFQSRLTPLWAGRTHQDIR